MINEDRVILMTKLASYESGPGKKNVAISNYFRGDYIGFQILQSIISATLAYAIVVGIYLFYHFEDLMLDIYQMDLMAIGKDALKYYLIMVAAYCVLSYIVYSYRYHKARKSLKNYYHNLRKLTQSH
jgi:formate hydrogenlyase subunit 3/multisubunit Na+/H+ antiporter MnhD subunit